MASDAGLFGSYVNETWKETATMPYAPLYFASAVLPAGRVLVEGGEYVMTNSIPSQPARVEVVS